ncbi:MAG TPA: hypothetical protein VFP71_02080, partial [Candidatus Angelobacter sp.]|nr:hypothetical protein [Candidatus Angelobacter sp.]
MSRLMHGYSWLVCAFIVCALPGLAQQNLPDGPAPKNSQPQQGVPDAPQPKNPNGFPNNAPPAPINNHEESAPSPTPTPAAAENPAPNSLPSKREELY